jgi:hypothetical protein
MDGQAREESTGRNIYDQVERVGKVLPLALAGLYLVGFLIVALHLAGYGASSLNLIRIQYLAAGFWFGCILVLFFGITTPVSSSLSERANRGAKSAFWALGGATGLAVVALVDVFMFATLGLMAYFTPRISSTFGSEKIIEGSLRAVSLAHSMRFLVLGLIIFDITLRRWHYLKEKGQGPSSRGLYLLQSWRMFQFFVVAVFMLCIQLFARDVYPTISFSLGGGKPRQVVFWLGTSTASDSLLERDHSNPYTVPYELLLENENSIVVVSQKDGQRAIEFDRKAVNAVIVLGKRPKSAPENFQREAIAPANDRYEVVERSQKEVSNFMAKGLHTEVDYVLLHNGYKFYAACDMTTLDKLDPTATCALRVLRSYEYLQPVDDETKKALSDLKCKDDEGHPVYLYVSKKE